MRSWVLFVSGHRNDVLQLTRMLRGLHVLVDHASNVKQACNKLHQRYFEAVLTEAQLSDCSWKDILNATSESPTQVIVTDPQGDARLWCEALNLGAFDLLPQPFYEPEVRRIVLNVCSRPALARAAG